MSKLFTLRECLDVEDVARHLSGSFNEAVTAKDVLNIIMEGSIPISVRFKFPVTVRNAKIVEATPTGRWGIDFLHAGREEEKYLTLFGERRCLEGVVDLALIGSHTRNLVSSGAWHGVLDEEIAADDLLLHDRDGNLVALVNVITDGFTAMTEEASGEFSFSFPRNSELVIRTSAVRALEERLAGPAITSEVKTKERRTLLCIIAALAGKANIKVNPPHTGKAALSIESLTQELGARVSKRAIEEHLKLIPDALETRMK